MVGESQYSLNLREPMLIGGGPMLSGGQSYVAVEGGFKVRKSLTRAK